MGQKTLHNANGKNYNTSDLDMYGFKYQKVIFFKPHQSCTILVDTLSNLILLNS